MTIRLMTMAVLLAACALALPAGEAAAAPDGCGHARGLRGGTVAFERAHPTSGGEHGGFWGGWKGLADGCISDPDVRGTRAYQGDAQTRGRPPTLSADSLR